MLFFSTLQSTTKLLPVSSKHQQTVEMRKRVKTKTHSVFCCQGIVHSGETEIHHLVCCYKVRGKVLYENDTG